MADETAFTTTRAPRRRYLNDEGVARLRPRPKRYTHADPELTKPRALKATCFEEVWAGGASWPVEAAY